MYSLSSSSSWPLPLAPISRRTGWPSLKTMSVGMLITSKRRAASGLSSTLSLAMLTLPACSVAISSRIGAIILHGPHHSAQKSTMTTSALPAISSSKVESVRVLMPSAMWFASFGSWSVLGTPRVPDAFQASVQVLQVALGVDGGHAARARCGDRLGVHVVLDVAAGEHAFDVGRGGPGTEARDQVAAVLHRELALEQRGVRLVSDGDEQPGHGQRRLFVGEDVAHHDRLDLRVANDVGDGAVPEELDLRVV